MSKNGIDETGHREIDSWFSFSLMMEDFVERPGFDERGVAVQHDRAVGHLKHDVKPRKFWEVIW